MTRAPAILVVTGASGVGKTTAVRFLEARARPRTACFYFDDIGVPTAEVIEREFGGPERWQADATERWIRRLVNEGDANRVNVLDGQTRPSFIRAALARVEHVRANVVLLDCERSVREERLISRGQPELATEHMQAWAAYLRGQADALELAVIPTAGLTVERVAELLDEHVEALRNGALQA